jgi:hypothetical protein
MLLSSGLQAAVRSIQLQQEEKMHNGSIEQIAWSAGIKARTDGISRSKNPYLKTGPVVAIKQWYEGYNLAEAILPTHPINETYQKDI